MPYLASWATHDRKVLVHLADQAVTTFAAHAQRRSSDTESGGILLGCVRGTNLEILHATEPSATDSRFRFLFERSSNNHREIAEAFWHQSRGTVRYLGEWHTHPEDLPSPSNTDKTEWSLLANKRLDNRPLLALIVGRQGLHLELVFKNSESKVLESL